MFTEEYVAIWRHWVTAIRNWAPISFMLFISGKGLSHTGQLINSHYNNVIMSAMAPQISSLMILYSTVYSDADQRKYQSSASLAFVREFTGDQCMTHTKGQWRGKYSSWWRHHDPFINIAQWFQTKNDGQLTRTKQCSGQVCILYDEA